MPLQGPTYFYVDCAKTASQALIKVLHDQFDGAGAGREDAAEAAAAGMYIFASVRNPYDRALSLWHSLVSPGDKYGIVAAGKTEPVACLRYLSSGAFLRGLDALGKTGRHTHLTRTCSECVGAIKLDAVIHFESLLADFNHLSFVTEPLAEIPIINRKSWGRPDRWPLKDPRFLQLVEEWMADDFERFGYEVGVMPEESA